MKSIGEVIKEKNITLDTLDPVAAQGFTQVPNFILKDPKISVGAKIVYAMFLSYAWHNDSCFPGQERLAEDMGLTRVRVTQLTSELEAAGFVSIQRRGAENPDNVLSAYIQQTELANLRALNKAILD